jgi:hypothetical protein
MRREELEKLTARRERARAVKSKRAAKKPAARIFSPVSAADFQRRAEELSINVPSAAFEGKLYRIRQQLGDREVIDNDLIPAGVIGPAMEILKESREVQAGTRERDDKRAEEILGRLSRELTGSTDEERWRLKLYRAISLASIEPKFVMADPKGEEIGVWDIPEEDQLILYTFIAGLHGERKRAMEVAGRGLAEFRHGHERPDDPDGRQSVQPGTMVGVSGGDE